MEPCATLISSNRRAFQMFASGVAVSHAYAHIFDFGGKVSVGGMEVEPGDLIHGDRHGVQTVPLEIAAASSADGPGNHEAKAAIRSTLCHSADFSIEKLRKAIQETEDFAK